jgi:hypothetical protein
VLASGFNEDQLHKLVQQNWCVCKVVNQLLGNCLEISPRKFVQKDTDFSNLFVKFVFLGQRLLSETIHISPSLFVREI